MVVSGLSSGRMMKYVAPSSSPPIELPRRRKYVTVSSVTTTQLTAWLSSLKTRIRSRS